MFTKGKVGGQVQNRPYEILTREDRKFNKLPPWNRISSDQKIKRMLSSKSAQYRVDQVLSIFFDFISLLS